MQWYYAIDDQRRGPVNQTEFERLVHTGTISHATLVWRKPMPAWQSLAEVLAADPAAAALPESVPPPLPALAAAEASTLPSTATAPANSMPPPAAAAPAVYGGFWRRVAAWGIDFFILLFARNFIITAIGARFYPDELQLVIKLNGHLPTPEQALALHDFPLVACGIMLLIGLAYDCFFLKKYAATPGKLALGLAVRRTDGSPLSFGRIIGRYFARALNNLTLGLSFLAVAFDDQKRGIHDCLCDTRVVRVERH